VAPLRTFLRAGELRFQREHRALAEDHWAVAFGALNLGYLSPASTQLTPNVFWRNSPITSDSPSPIIPV
jgi:hypothetical protein